MGDSSDGERTEQLPTVNIGVVGGIPEDYVPDAAVRLNLNARLLRMRTPTDVDAFNDEFEDRFGDPPDDVLTLLRVTKLKLKASQFGILMLEAGPKGIAIEFAFKPTRKLVKAFSRASKPIQRERRLVYERQFEDARQRLAFLEDILVD
jgi:transcription-repair coupling factor (superfamily II helicase)